jgi:hypothetical protein
LDQAQDFIGEDDIDEAKIIYEQVIGAVLRSLDANLAISVCETAANARDEDIIGTLLPACDWAAALALQSTSGTTAFNVCEAGQGNPATVAAVADACNQIVNDTLESESLTAFYEICSRGTSADEYLANLVSPLCEELMEDLPAENNRDDVFFVCLNASAADQTVISTTACNRLVDLVAEDLNGLSYCFTAGGENLGEVTADICRSSFIPHVQSVPYFSAVLDCLDFGEIQAGSETAHACQFMAEAARDNASASANNEICTAGLQESPELVNAFFLACQAAVELDPGNGEYYGPYGVGLSLLGNEDGALEALNTYFVWAAETENEAELVRASTLLEQVEAGIEADPLLLNGPLSQEQTAP